MYISERIIFPQMQKTGCTHITRILMKYDGGIVVSKHEPIQRRSDVDGRIVLGSIRNPWDWYVSLWAYGCSGRGTLRKYLAADPLSRFKPTFPIKPTAGAKQLAHAIIDWRLTRLFEPLYRDVESVTNFRNWLKLILGDVGRRSLPGGYRRSSLSESLGLMSYRHLHFSASQEDVRRFSTRNRNFSSIRDFYEQFCLTDHVIRLESLSDDLSQVFKRLNLRVSESELEGIERTNTSKHRSFSDYYDSESADLVMKRDTLIVEQFGYSRPFELS